MKLQELFENQEQVVRFDTIDEYHNFIDMQSRDDNRYHFEEVPAPDGEIYDVIVEVTDFRHTPGSGNMYGSETPEDFYGDTELDWRMVLFGTGNFDTDRDFWFKRGEFPLNKKYEDMIENHILEDQMYHRE